MSSLRHGGPLGAAVVHRETRAPVEAGLESVEGGEHLPDAQLFGFGQFDAVVGGRGAPEDLLRFGVGFVGQARGQAGFEAFGPETLGVPAGGVLPVLDCEVGDVRGAEEGVGEGRAC